MMYDLKVLTLLSNVLHVVTVEAETDERAIADWQTGHPNDIVIAWRETPDESGHPSDAE
jgi:hypothetical protein